MGFEPTVELSRNDILRECSKNKFMILDHEFYIRLAVRKAIGKVFSYKKFNDDFCDTLLCFNDGEHVVGYIRPNYNEFLRKLVNILNLKIEKIVDNDTLTIELLKRLEVLKGLKSESELEIEFPVLYKDLIEGRSYISDERKLKGKVSKEALRDYHDYYYRCGLRYKFKDFISKQYEVYKKYVIDRGLLKEEFSKMTFNGFFSKEMNMGSLYMYIIDRYLYLCEHTNDMLLIKKYIKLIEMYAGSDIDKSPSIVSSDGTVIDFPGIMGRLYRLKNRVNSTNKSVDWIIIPDERDLSRVKAEGKPRTTKMSRAEIERLTGVGTDRNSFYEGTNYYVKAIGLKRYKGYVAYIYLNGEVILDREFNAKAPSSGSGNAIYNLKIEDFEVYSKLGKSVLRKSPKVGRIVHSSKWKERVSEIIGREETEESRNKTIRIVKNLRR